MNIQSIEARWPDLAPAPALKEKMWTGKNWDGTNWIFLSDWEVHVKAKDYEFILCIRKGFITDGGSIPQIVQNIFKAMGVYLLAYLIHDGMYGGELLTRLQGDNILFDVLQFQGMTWFGRENVYSAVRIGGGIVWEGHKSKPDVLALNKTLLYLEIIKQPRSVDELRVPDFRINELYYLRNGIVTPVTSY